MGQHHPQISLFTPVQPSLSKGSKGAAQADRKFAQEEDTKDVFNPEIPCEFWGVGIRIKLLPLLGTQVGTSLFLVFLFQFKESDIKTPPNVQTMRKPFPPEALRNSTPCLVSTDEVNHSTDVFSAVSKLDWP